MVSEPISTEDQDALVSFRNFETPVPRNPLRDFKGTFEKYRTETRTFRDGGTGLYVVLDFTDVQVIEAAEPYDFPIATLDFPYSRRRTSRWTILGDSATKLLKDDQDIRDAVGMRLHMKMATYDLYDGRAQKAVPQLAWEVVGIEGTGTAVKQSPGARALEILDGKTLAQFNQEVLKDPLVRTSPIAQDVMAGTFVSSQIELMVVTVDSDKVHHVLKD